MNPTTLVICLAMIFFTVNVAVFPVIRLLKRKREAKRVAEETSNRLALQAWQEFRYRSGLSTKDETLKVNGFGTLSYEPNSYETECIDCMADLTLSDDCLCQHCKAAEQQFVEQADQEARLLLGYQDEED